MSKESLENEERINQIDFKIDRVLSEEEKKAVDITRKLQDSGFESYFAGGAVRDELLGLPTHAFRHDIDIATSAKPDEVQKLFPKNYEKGKSFGVIAVHDGDSEFEVATFRSDIGIFDHRRPEKVEFTSAEEDAKRRDFTINGLFYDPIKEKIIDFVRGLEDLKGKVIRFIGDPKARIDEDYLRMLRAVRFSSKLGFMIEPKSKEAIRENVKNIKYISQERIRDEVSKTLVSKNRETALRELDDLGILKEILPELESQKGVPQPPEFHTEGDVWTHTLLALKNSGENPSEELVWAILLHDSAKPETQGHREEVGKTSIIFFDHDVQSAQKASKILQRLKFSNQFVENVTWAIRQHMRIIHAFQGMSERKQKKLFSDPNIQLLLDLTHADVSASIRPNGKVDLTMYNDALNLREKFDKETTDEEKLQVKKFDLITGEDIMKILNLKPSPEVGSVKKKIEEAYLNGEFSTREEALALVETYRR